MPRVSVILPTKNRAYILGRAIRSILAQTFSDFELIIVDDGSKDTTADVVSQFADSRIRYLRRDQSSGASAARNYGITHSESEFIAFQDSDDEWLVNKLECQLHVIDGGAADVSLVCCEYLIDSINGSASRFSAGDKAGVKRWSAKEIYEFGFITPTWLLRRSFLADVGLFDESLPNLEDWEFSFRLHNKCSIAILDTPLVLKHGSRDSVNSIRSDRIKSIERIIRKHRSIWDNEPKVLAKLYGELGSLQCATGQCVDGRLNLWLAMQNDMFEARYLRKFIASFAGSSGYRRIARLMKN